MENHTTNSPNFSHKIQAKYKSFKALKKAFFEYLKTRTAPASMATALTAIFQKNITRFKMQLEKAGVILHVERKTCMYTGFRAWDLTTSPKLFPVNVKPSNTAKL